MDEAPTVSTHVLDLERGRPSAGIAVRLFRLGEVTEIAVGAGTTDTDGRIRRLLEGPLTVGDYRLEAELSGPFFRRVSLTFRVSDASRSCHVPLLIAPFSVATYRGS